MGKSKQSARRLALIFLVVGALSFGLSPVVTKLCAFPATVIATMRMLIAGLLLAPLGLPRLRALLAERGWPGLLLLLVPGFLLGLHFQFWVMGIKQTLVASGTFIISISPLFFALAERLIGRQRIRLVTLIPLALVAAGAIWLFRVNQGRLGQVGDLLCFLSVLVYVVYLLVSRQVSRGVPHLLYIHLIYFWGGVLTLPFAILSGDLARVDLGDASSLWALLALVVFPTLIGHTSQNFGVRTLSPLTVSFFIPLEPVLATLAAIPVLGEIPDPVRLPSYLLFLLATVFYLTMQARRA